MKISRFQDVSPRDGEKKESFGKKIIFLESATKKKTIQSFLGKDYVIFATSGHLWELKKEGVYNLGVDLESFIPKYEIIPSKENLIKYWKNYIKKKEIEEIYLATDPDREGEAIAKETAKILGLNQSQYKRLLFYEITPRSIKESLKNPLEINEKLVEAQLSRQVLDRMIGFCLSTFLRKKMQAYSAGRVQSIVLKLIIEREKLVKDYEKEKEYIICAFAKKNEDLVLKQVNKEDQKLVVYKDKEAAEEILKNLESIFFFDKKEEIEKYIVPKPPLVTSSLLFEAKSQLGFTVSQTTKTAQSLYEGITIDEKGKRIGLITYPRTDSIRMNKDFSGRAHTYISEKWGKDYCNFKPLWLNLNKKKSNVQDAHESIHPTYLEKNPEDIKKFLTLDEYLLYKLIFNHSLASLMSPARILKINYFFTNKKMYYFRSSKKIVRYLGFLACSEEYLKIYRVEVKNFLEKEKMDFVESNKIEIQDYTKNKPIRYNEGTMVQELEKLGIGRPSTYNTFGKIILERGYAELDKRGYFVPTKLGYSVNEWLQNNFFSLINEGYTANLEKDLDKISQGENSYLNFISSFWRNFSNSFKNLT